MFASKSHSRPISPAPPEPAGWLAPLAFVASAAVPLVILIFAAATGRSTSPVTWYLARASGLVLYLVIWASVVLGLGLTTGQLDRVVRRGTVYSLHRFLTALSYGFVSLHLMSLFIDEAVPFSLTDLLVPFAADWNRIWTALGAGALYLLLLVGAASAAIRRLSYRWWRRSHWLTFPLYLLALGHGLGAGSDSGSAGIQLLYVVTATVVVWLGAYRALRGRGRMATRDYSTEPVHDRLARRDTSPSG